MDTLCWPLQLVSWTMRKLGGRMLVGKSLASFTRLVLTRVCFHLWGGFGFILNLFTVGIGPKFDKWFVVSNALRDFGSTFLMLSYFCRRLNLLKSIRFYFCTSLEISLCPSSQRFLDCQDIRVRFFFTHQTWKNMIL